MTWRSLPENEDWLLVPVVRGMCRYESLGDGTLDLADIALMHDMLAVQADNEEIARRAMEARNG
ncbi:DUF6889 family protein [Microvirgula aerodenitrificans]|uniref:DUF6889 family protein n=1 Tax=Microvirgula aerodenitrificans TaxID=57480 RepID=UPI00248F190B|nr:hypothetical protein [Microvirgula aerodenitrificans]